jgi:ankyrin repeat protein
MMRYLVKELGAAHRGCTPLWEAANQGELGAVRLLLGLGADINLADNFIGVTPLMVATFKKHEEVVKWLVKAGADTQIFAEYTNTVSNSFTMLAAKLKYREEGALLPSRPHTWRPRRTAQMLAAVVLAS